MTSEFKENAATAGWYEFIHPIKATTDIAHVSESGEVYLPEAHHGVTEEDFHLAAASNRFWRLGRIEDMESELAARDASVAALSERCTAKGLELDRVIREAAADKAKLAALPDLETIRRIERERGNWGLRLGQIRAELSSHLSESTDPCMDHGNEYPCDVKQALDAAPEMPRPPAEELAAKLAEIQSDLDALESRRDAPPETGREYLQRMGAEFRSNMARLKARDEADAERDRLAAQERAGDADTSPAGSGRGTGVTEAPGTAQESDWPNVDGWTLIARPTGILLSHDTDADRPLLLADELPLGAVLAFIEDQQPEEENDEEPDLSLVPADLIKSDPGIRGGEPCITGTRIPASEVAGYLADGATWDEVREMLPSLPSLTVPSTEGEPDV